MGVSIVIRRIPVLALVFCHSNHTGLVSSLNLPSCIQPQALISLFPLPEPFRTFTLFTELAPYHSHLSSSIPSSEKCTHVCSVVSDVCDPEDCSQLGSSVRGISQARILVWVAIPIPRGLPKPGIELWSSVSPALADRFFITAPPEGSSSKVMRFWGNYSDFVHLFFTVGHFPPWNESLRGQGHCLIYPLVPQHLGQTPDKQKKLN